MGVMDDWLWQQDQSDYTPDDSGTGDTYDDFAWQQQQTPYEDYSTPNDFGSEYIDSWRTTDSYNPDNNTMSTGGGIENTLSSIFSGGMDNPLIGKGLSALMEGYQNNKKASAMNKIAKGADPFGSQRGFYQTQARNAVTNPYDSPIVKAQVEQLQRAQDIKDAAAGRRSNKLTSSPAVMAQMAQIAQQYQQQMATQGGAGFGPSAAGISAATSGANAGINGYISPLLSLLGNTQQTNTNDSVLANLTQQQKTALAKQWANQ